MEVSEECFLAKRMLILVADHGFSHARQRNLGGTLFAWSLKRNIAFSPFRFKTAQGMETTFVTRSVVAHALIKRSHTHIPHVWGPKTALCIKS